MKRDKQIEEMAKELWKFAPILSENNCQYVAEELVDKGYRKASDLVREIFEDIDRMCIDTFGNFNHRVFAELKKKYTEGEE